MKIVALQPLQILPFKEMQVEKYLKNKLHMKESLPDIFLTNPATSAAFLQQTGHQDSRESSSKLHAVPSQTENSSGIKYSDNPFAAEMRTD